MIKFSSFSEELLLELNYKHHDPIDVDAKLIHRALHQHLSDPSNYDKHAVGEHPVHVKDLNVPRPLKSKYKNTQISFPTDMGKNTGKYRKSITKRKILGKELPSRFDKEEHQIHLHVDGSSHAEFLHGLKHNTYPSLRHELEHHHDTFNTVHTKDQTEYHNLDHEVKAFTAERKHQIHRSFIQNRSDLGSHENLGHLPLKDRLKHYSRQSMSVKLNIIDRHSSPPTDHSHWYNTLNPENKKKVDSHFQPIIDRHTR
jgi:hypothetical protein